ncbi:hypothetical protein FBU59_000164 [Linderina macrospora]|uniref:Uncharacterized protein n=1 Tax=Linderina macrospora TaxID=4868 RepID=A0ACC1JHX8_9FUNG|nr:hypothetical protein FBU59_000164 [Linderina macrospora]
MAKKYFSKLFHTRRRSLHHSPSSSDDRSDTNTITDATEIFSKWRTEDLPTEPDAALSYLRHLISVKQTLDRNIETLLPSAYREILTTTVTTTSAQPFNLNALTTAGHDVSRQNAAFTKLARSLTTTNDSLQAAIFEYLEMLPDSSEKHKLAKQCRSMRDTRRWGQFDSFEFVCEPLVYLDQFMPEDVDWREFLIEYASPLVAYYIEVEVDQEMGWEGARKVIQDVFGTARERETLLEWRSATVAFKSCVEVLDYRKSVDPNVRCSIRTLAATCSDKQQQVFVDTMRKLSIPRPSRYDCEKLRGYLSVLPLQ